MTICEICAGIVGPSWIESQIDDPDARECACDGREGGAHGV